ncbi:MAG: 2-isopropylmalate synthase [Vicinamibacteria bacterium]|nr:2-isopropylmalate synthase [Vicinamibacteria bacterium]
MSDEASKQVIIFDTTLRDGEQSPGCSMNLTEKLQVAHALKELGVDVIEAGFPIASTGDFEAVRAVAREVEGPAICGLARCNDKDIDRAWEAVKESKRPRIHVFLATSAIHREHKLKMAKEEIVRRAREGVMRAKGCCPDVEFSPEDAARTELDFLTEVVLAAIDVGAKTINVPDTVGYAVPVQFGAVIRHLREKIDGRAVISVHCHNDLGLAVANTLSAVAEGARQVECTINGLGERAGNCSLEEVVMALRTRHDFFNVTTGINTRRLYPASRLVANVTGMRVQRNKAIVGQNAFSHEAGIHQHGVLQHQATYEIMRPEDVGFARSNLVLGKHSGRHALRARVEEMGYHMSEDAFERLFEGFKGLADKKKEIYDADIEALIEDRAQEATALWEIVSFHISTATGALPTAAVALQKSGGERFSDAAVGDGPIDALFTAIERITGVNVVLKDYEVRSVTVGEDAQGEVSVEVEHGGRSWRGQATSTDILEASARAFLLAVNRIALRNAGSEAAVAAAVNDVRP